VLREVFHKEEGSRSMTLLQQSAAAVLLV